MAVEDGQRLGEVLDQGRFAVTVEYNPPKGTNITGLLENAQSLVGRVHGVNVTDNTAAVMRASSLSVCRLLYEMGHDPVVQVTCRDRNRIGIQSDLLGAHLLGIRNVLCLTGDYPTVGDHKDAKPGSGSIVSTMESWWAMSTSDRSARRLDGSRPCRVESDR